ncbi:hypothetical protein JY471_14705 [Stenotrophomonas maltophilia]|uniref:hypothetical protein n=1 Tax=Stenotrophomonas maltophilia TaxID=40324 RepID=UPI001299A9A2|nr:hypothetical protein [Stenotrophomonas maltophilia]MBN5143778.1 hypothetical protein [Stenotrophomonas maltophilia]BBO49893.1 hypothetical protein KMM349_02240 [Stenotrophomonas maltophilia]
MKSKPSLSFKCLLAFALALGSTTWPGLAALDRLSAAVERTMLYRVGSAEAIAVAQWLDSRENAHRRTLALGMLTVRHRCDRRKDPHLSANVHPLVLPHSGAPGEKIAITNDLPGRGSETWTFAWAGDGQDAHWQQTDYGWHLRST